MGIYLAYQHIVAAISLIIDAYDIVSRIWLKVSISNTSG